MLKGLALTPPVVGRIAIGRVVEKNGRRRAAIGRPPEAVLDLL